MPFSDVCQNPRLPPTGRPLLRRMLAIAVTDDVGNGGSYCRSASSAQLGYLTGSTVFSIGLMEDYRPSTLCSPHTSAAIITT
jgi:hypothetical protein